MAESLRLHNNNNNKNETEMQGIMEGRPWGKKEKRLKKKSCSNSHSPCTFYIVDFSERVNVHQPKIRPFGVGHHQRVKKRFASSQLAKFHLELSEPADQVDI